MRNKKVFIIGKVMDKWQTPFYLEDFDIWLCNWHEDFKNIPRYNLWFDIHKKPNSKVLKYIPSDKLILRDEKIFDEAFEKMQGEYLNNSMCYMLFYALIEGYEYVKFYGCRLNNSQEEQRTRQKEALNAVIMFCRGWGMIVESNNSDLIFSYDRYII